MNILCSSLLMISICVVYCPKMYTNIDAALDKYCTPHAHSQTLHLIDDGLQPHHDHYARYMRAIYLHKSGALRQSLLEYQKLLKNKAPVYLYDGYFSLLFDIGLFKRIVHIVDEQKNNLDALIKNNLELQLIIAQAFLHCDRDNEASTRFLALYHEFPDNEHVAYYSVVAYLKKNQLDQARKLIATCLNNASLKSKHFLFYFLQSKIFLQEQNIPAAGKAIDCSLELFPKFERAWLLKAMLMEQQGEISSAIHGYKNFLSLVGRDESIEKQLIQLLFTQEKYEEAAHYLKQLDGKSPEYFFDLALVHFKAGKLGKALADINKVLTLSPSFSKAMLLKTEILVAQKNSAALLVFIEHWLTESKEDYTALHTLLLLKNNKLSPKLIIKVLENIVDQNKCNQNHYAMLADLYSETKQHDKALKFYNTLLKKVDDPTLQAKILGHIAHEQYTLHHYKELQTTFEQAEKLGQQDPALNNLRAYYYAEQQQKFPEALALIDAALAIVPTCSHYLDTKGYILLKQGKKQEAEALFIKALEGDPHDATIKKHLEETR